MPISAEVKMFVAGLGNDEVWKKLPLDKEPNHTFISDLKEQILDLVGTVRSDKAGGLTGHIGLIMPAAEFQLIPDIHFLLFDQHTRVQSTTFSQQIALPLISIQNKDVNMRCYYMYLRWSK